MLMLNKYSALIEIIPIAEHGRGASDRLRTDERN